MSSRFKPISAYIRAQAQEGSAESTELQRGTYPNSKGVAAYPLHSSRMDECRIIQEGELVLLYKSGKPSDGGGCTTSSFNGFDVLEKAPHNTHMLALKLTMVAYMNFTFCGVCLYDVSETGKGAVLRCGVVTTQNNSGKALQVGEAVCWMCEDPQKVGNGKARAKIVTQSDLKAAIEQYRNTPGAALPADFDLLVHAMLTPFGRVMKTSPHGGDVKIQLFA